MVPVGTYGVATDAVNQILALGHSLMFFPSVTTVGDEDLALMRRHHELYRLAVGSAPGWHPMVVLGDSAVLRSCRERVTRRVEDHGFDLWSVTLAQQVTRLADALPDKSAVFKPPLWSVPGLYNVVSKLSIAPPKDVFHSFAAGDRDLFWKLACEVDNKFWNAIQWEVVRQDELTTNPYYPLLQLFSKGLYPIGLESDLFVVFGRR
jgi:hypothetical protein